MRDSGRGRAYVCSRNLFFKEILIYFLHGDKPINSHSDMIANQQFDKTVSVDQNNLFCNSFCLA